MHNFFDSMQSWYLWDLALCQLVMVQSFPRDVVEHGTESLPPYVYNPHDNAILVCKTRLLLGLEVVEEDGALSRLLTPVLDDDARAVDNLSRVALTVENAKTGPLAELLSVGNLDEGDLVLGAESDDELLVGLLLAGLVQDTHVSLAAVEGLGSLAETAGKTVVHESELQDTLEGVKNRHLALGGIGRNLNLLGDLGGVVLFYVRHLECA